MQSKKSQPSGQRIMPESRLISFPAYSVNPRAGISLSESENDDLDSVSPLWKNGAKTWTCNHLPQLSAWGLFYGDPTDTTHLAGTWQRNDVGLTDVQVTSLRFITVTTASVWRHVPGGKDTTKS